MQKKPTSQESARRNGFLARPFCQATLAEHRQLARQAHRDVHGPAVERQIRHFLKGSETDLVSELSEHLLYEVPNLHRALTACFPTWKVVLETGEPEPINYASPACQRFEIAPGRYQNYLVKGSRFYEQPGAGRRVVTLEKIKDGVLFKMIAHRRYKEELQREQETLAAWMEKHHYLQNQAIRADGTLLPATDRVTWEEVALEPRVRAALEDNVIKMLKLRDLFIKNGIPQKRGILLYGPPGNGKTMIGKVLAGLGLATFLWVTAAKAIEAGRLPWVFNLARQLRPTIVFLEDLDLYASERNGRCSRLALGEILTQMDGLEENDGIITVATTNDLDAIEPALKDRPSRFEIVLEIGLPSPEARRQILEKSLHGALAEVRLITEAANLADDLSGAQVHELAYLAVQRAILRGATDETGRARPDRADLYSAIERLQQCQKGRFGFTSV